MLHENQRAWNPEILDPYMFTIETISPYPAHRYHDHNHINFESDFAISTIKRIVC